MGEYENLNPQEQEEIDDIASAVCADIFGGKEKKKGGWPKGKKRKAAMINQEFESAFNETHEKEEIAPAQPTEDTSIEISVMPVAVREALEGELEVLERTIQTLNKEVEDKKAQIRRMEQKYKVIADYLKKGV